MIRRMKLATLLLFLAVTAAGVDGPLPRTGGFANGRYWVDAPYQEKLGFVLGFFDGIRTPTTNDDKANRAIDSYQKILFGPSTFGEIITGLDDFYSDPANRLIQVSVAMMYFKDKASGASPESLAKDLAGYRKWAAGHVDQQ
jgi:hypothetical protein